MDYHSSSATLNEVCLDVCINTLFGWFAIYRECHRLLGQSGSGGLICWQSDGDELYEVINAQTKRFDETNWDPVIIGTLHGPYASISWPS